MRLKSKLKQYNDLYWHKLLIEIDLHRPLYEQFKEEKSRVKSSRMKLELKPEKVELYTNTDPVKLENKELKHWFDWWQNSFNTNDYFKYLSTQSSDYVGLLFHMYDDSKESAVELTDYEMRLEEERKKAEK